MSKSIKIILISVIVIALGYIVFIAQKPNIPKEEIKIDGQSEDKNTADTILPAENDSNYKIEKEKGFTKLYFVKSPNNIYKLYRANLDGSDEKEISSISEFNQAQLSPDKQEIAFKDEGNIKVQDMNGRNFRSFAPVREISDDKVAKVQNFFWTNDSNSLIYESLIYRKADLSSDNLITYSEKQIGIISKDGSDKKIFYSNKTDLQKNIEDVRTFLGYSLDKKELYLLAKPTLNEDIGFGELEIINTENGVKKILKFGQNNWTISNVKLSSDMSKIFFLSIDNETYNVAVYDLSSEKQQIIVSYDKGTILSILPSPDGSKIIYKTQLKADKGCGKNMVEIYIADLEKKSNAKIVDELGSNSGPISWSPDQSLILFYHEGYANECMISGGKGDLDRYYIISPSGDKAYDFSIIDYNEQYAGPYLQVVGWGN